ncbi:hypothetical protein MKX01_026289 [Papaver californicum]|nr:hypothetical protein MKX01_026289 [Papaver californicum]
MPVRVAESSAPSQITGGNNEHSLPPACTVLSVGQELKIFQAYKRMKRGELMFEFKDVTLIMLNVPLADTPLSNIFLTKNQIQFVVTFWEGEIVDTKNYTFFTGKWEATPEDDIRHWSKFPSFNPLLADWGKSLDLSNYPYIFMRWKEQYFVNVGIDCGLTIAGFYYVCFSCSDGSINGFYYDPKNSPFQKLELKSTNEGRSGFSFSSYQLQ